MNKQETVALIALLDRAGLTKAREGMEDAWLMVLESFRAQDALEATKRLIATRCNGNTWVVPGDVLEEIIHLRRERINNVLRGALPAPPREIHPDDIGPYMAWVKAFVRALGDGRTLHDAETVACEAAGIEPVHRPVEVHRAPDVRQIDSGPSSSVRAGAAARAALAAAVRRAAEPKESSR